MLAIYDHLESIRPPEHLERDARFDPPEGAEPASERDRD
jgi:hypothetical protein